jgi:pyridoxine 5-phosphate synthase
MRLSVNIDHVATVRQARHAREPEPVAAALLCELAGAEGITVHLRGDRRHINDRDVQILREVVSTKLNVEMAATPEMTAIAARIRPDQVTLVPEREGELTTEGGLDVITHRDAVRRAVHDLRAAGVRVSVFVNPDERQMVASRACGADAAEINTGPYTSAPLPSRESELARVVTAARAGAEQGLEVLGGHGLTYVNVQPVVAIPEIVELNIGHSIVARAVLVGLERAVREMVALLHR